MSDELAKSCLFGVTMASAVGPIALLILSYGICDGLKPAAAAGLGAALADLIYAGVAFALGSLLLSALARHDTVLKLAAALTLVLLGTQEFVSEEQFIERAKRQQAGRRRAFGASTRR